MFTPASIMSDEEKKKNTSLITNPAIVKSALNASKKNGETPNSSPQKHQRPKSTSTTKDALSATSNTNDNANANGKKKEKKQNNQRPKSEGSDKQSDKKKDVLKKPKSAPQQKKSSPPVTPRKKPERSLTDPDNSNGVSAGEDLKSILFPDLYGKKNGQTKPRNINNTPKRGPPGPPVFENTPNGSRFAGSSFSSSSPAPSALPKPSFKMKSTGDEPSSVTPPSSSGSLFDQFMNADRQERQARATAVVNAPVVNQHQAPQQAINNPAPSAINNNNNSNTMPNQQQQQQQPHWMYAQYQPTLHPPHSSSQSPVSY